ncbi:hypothetical protein Bca101_078570 [Brassica carinata]
MVIHRILIYKYKNAAGKSSTQDKPPSLVFFTKPVVASLSLDNTKSSSGCKKSIGPVSVVDLIGGMTKI